MDLIREIYRVEHRAKEQNVIGTPAHQEMREFESLPWLDKLYVWLAEQKQLHAPKKRNGKSGQLLTQKLASDDQVHQRREDPPRQQSQRVGPARRRVGSKEFPVRRK